MKIKNYIQVKQILCLVSLLLISLNLVGQEEIREGYRNGRQINGTKVERNLEGEVDWQDKDTTIYVYDNQQRLLKREYLYFNDTIWIARSRTLFEYDLDGLGYIQTDQQFYADVFKEEKHQITQEFNDQNQLVESIENDWINETWIKHNKTEYQYDEWGNIINIDFFRFVNDEWKLVSENIYEFDDLGNQTLNIYRQITLAGIIANEFGNRIERDTINGLPVITNWELYDEEWSLYYRETQYFSDNNILDSILIERRAGSVFKHIFEYDSENQLIQKTAFEIENNKREPFLRYNYEYDGNGNLILELGALWSNDEGDWFNYLPLQKEWTYSQNGSLIKEVDYTEWVIEYEPWGAFDRNITYYATPNSLTVSIDVLPKDFSVQIFPNPTPQLLTIKLSGNTSYPLQITIVNLQGQILKEQRMDTNLSSLSLEDLPNGTYFVQIRNEYDIFKVSKVIKQ